MNHIFLLMIIYASLDLFSASKNTGVKKIIKLCLNLAEIAHRIGYFHDLSQQMRLVNTELLKLPMSTSQRLKVASMIVKDEELVYLFFSLEEDDKMEWVCMLLEGSII